MLGAELAAGNGRSNVTTRRAEEGVITGGCY